MIIFTKPPPPDQACQRTAPRTLAIELENLKQKAFSIAIAGSPRKVDAVLGMLRGNYCNVLITDEETAKALLSKAGNHKKNAGRRKSKKRRPPGRRCIEDI
jgi:hypothetical protein